MTKSIFRFVVAAAMAGTMATSAHAQVVLSFDDLPVCTGGALSTYQSWIQLSTGVTCQSTPNGWATSASLPNHALSASYGFLGFSFLNGPVTFNGMWASGAGTYYLELLNGGNVVSSRYVGMWGVPALMSSGYAGLVDQVRLSVYGGSSAFGIDDISFTPGESQGGTGTLVNETNATPEPATMLLVASGLGGIGALARRRRKRREENQQA